MWGFFVLLLLMIDMALIQNTFWALGLFSFLTHCVGLGISGIIALGVPVISPGHRSEFKQIKW